ncbi:hypothetical protein [Blautia luti]|uniref:hypothetical protein n=1 Tax=Blautia luti TaxID=89014 RepID=UPI003D7BCF41
MPYLAKSIFLTVSYLVLMTGIADLKMFFVSLMIFVGGILFDLYFSYNTLKNIGENWTVFVARVIIYLLAVIAVFGLVISILGISDVIFVTTINNTKYISFKNDELKEIMSIFKLMEIKFRDFLTILLIEICSCLPDFLICRINTKDKNIKN